MAYSIASLIAGLVFGFGLILSGMANPEKVLGFLDLAGQWDPSLALVMAGAIVIGVFAFQWAGKRPMTFFGREFSIPNKTSIDKRLVVGSLMFGAGWGIAGFCPGPAMVALGAGEQKAFVFVLAMVAGMMIFEVAEKLRAPA
ncbi:YeeE/YedE family protein [Marinobacter sp. CHS3-4]|uniref:YeeE/YedE family protein n=1 Tax=Marinobacter sp. CHS3-4 TaxID=3045174 RepID=UPI0024B497DA|nr:YeeE/YedE family protein [Marinobacter sp. CHS3-4]MDI9245454.1 YeeE/YedE family protein [Marinobacter sp. CHS3-4]